MERISQADVSTALGRLHQGLKAQTRESKSDQHRLLRKAFHYVTATLFKPTAQSQGATASGKKLHEVTHRVLQELFALLVGGDGFAPPRIRLLSTALVRELSPGDTPYFFRDNFGGDFSQYDSHKVKYFLPLLSELSSPGLLTQNIPNLVNWFTSEETSLGLKMSSLSNLLAVVQRTPGALGQDHIRRIEKQFVTAITTATLESRKTTSTMLFGVRLVSTSTACNVTELDGTPSREVFTCMNNSYDYSEDQIMNVHVFSSLYYWIFYLYQHQLLRERKKQSREDILSKLEHFGMVPGSAVHAGVAAVESDDEDDPEPRPRRPPGMRDAESSDAGEHSFDEQGIPELVMEENFRDVVISTCLRILSQVEREIVLEQGTSMRLGSRYLISDLDWMREFTEATSMEAIRILDLICLMDPSLVSAIFPSVKKVYERTANRQSGLVFSSVLQFFVNHGQHVIFDVDPVLHHFCVDYVSARYRRQLLAMSTLLFLRTNTSKILLHTGVFPKYFPAILKLLAWHPRTVSSEILPLIPAMVGPSTYAELLHTILDLPLTTTFMEHFDGVEDSTADLSAGKGNVDTNSPAFRAVQRYIMRNESGIPGVCVWETNSEAQLNLVKTLWKTLPLTPRVSSVCKLVPRFLRVYMNVLLTHAPPSCIEQVIPLLLQRFAWLYPVDFFLSSVHSLIIDTIQSIFQRCPGFLLSMQDEVINSMTTLFNSAGKTLVLHLCWIIGELLNPSICAEADGDITGYFDALELVAYEAISGWHDESLEKKKRAVRAHRASGSTGLEPLAAASGSRSRGSRGHSANPLHDDEDTLGSEASGPDHSRFDESAASGTFEAHSGAADYMGDDDSKAGAPKGEGGRESNAIFLPRLVGVVVGALVKLATTFPEFAPRVILRLLTMRNHFDNDTSPGMEFVRDRLSDSLQLLRHGSIVYSIYSLNPTRQVSGGSPAYLSHLSSLPHLSHNPAAFTQGGHLHSFELPRDVPLAQASNVSSLGVVERQTEARTVLEEDFDEAYSQCR